MTKVITANITFPANTAHFTNATAYIRLESISMLDMPATIVAETVQRQVNYSGEPLSFRLKGQMNDTTSAFNLRVHISMTNVDDVQRGDYVTKRNYSVETNDQATPIEVQVEAV